MDTVYFLNSDFNFHRIKHAYEHQIQESQLKIVHLSPYSIGKDNNRFSFPLKKFIRAWIAA